MNSRSLVFIVMSIGFAVGAVMLAQRWLAQSQPQVASVDTVPVVSMAVSVPAGTILQEKHLQVRSVAQEMAPKRGVSDINTAIGMVTRYPMLEGDALHPQKLARKGEGSVLASLIAENMRAVTIRVNDVVGVAGFLLPGNRVDVLVTLDARNRSASHWEADTEVILSNLKVLAVDQQATQDTNQPVVVRAVTLEVSLEQAEVLMSARHKGNIQLALRNPNDEIAVETASLVESPDTQKISVEGGDPNGQSKRTTRVIERRRMEVIRGVQKQTISVGRDQTITMAKKDGEL